MGQPIFSIGVTTCNRREMLKECLDSILSQSFVDFEVIVGNDYTGEKLYQEQFNINDKRVRFVNHQQNLGEIQNMNYLLKAAKGKYFSWLADDDMYMEHFLSTVNDALISFNFPRCVFTSFLAGPKFRDEMLDMEGCEGIRVLDGHRFLEGFLAKRYNVLGCYGVFDVEYLKRSGGISPLGDGSSIYSDNLLAIQCGLLDRVVYIDAPLLFFRKHEGSASAVATDIDAYGSAQKTLMVKCIDVFVTKTLIGDFDRNLFLLLKWLIKDFVYVVWRAGYISMKQVLAYLIFLKSNMKLVKNPFLIWSIMLCLIWAIVWEALLFAKHKAKLAGLLCK